MIFKQIISQTLETSLGIYEAKTQYTLSNPQPSHLGIWKFKQLRYTDEIFARVVEIIQTSQCSSDEKQTLITILKYLFDIALPVFILGMEKNPLHHNMQVVENSLLVVLGEKRLCEYRFIKKSIILALLHDVGTGLVEPDLAKIKSGDILNQIHELEKQNKSRKEITIEINEFIGKLERFRNAHMVEGAKIVGEILHELNCDEETMKDVVLSEKEIKEITVCISIHDAPSIVEGYDQVGKTFSKNQLIPLDHDLAIVLREADRLWMVSKEGLEKDLFDDLKKGRQPDAVKTLRHNVKRFKDEYALYSRAVDIIPQDLSRFKAKTLFQTDAGFRLLVRFIFERVQEILGKDHINIAVSLGGTKLSIALVFAGGLVLEIVPALDWRSEFAIDDHEQYADTLKDGLVEKITTVTRLIDGILGKYAVRKIGIATKGPLDVVNGVKILGKGKKLTTLPFKDYPLEDEIRTKLRAFDCSRHFEIDLIHDGVAAILGEVSPGGTLQGENNAAAIIIGTGIGIGILENGKIAHEELGSLGRYLVRVKEDEMYHYVFMTNDTGNEPVRDLNNLPKGYKQYKNSAIHFSERIAGPWLTRRLAKELISEHKQIFLQEIENVSGGIITATTVKACLNNPDIHKHIEKALLINLTEAAKNESLNARQWIISVAKEIGMAFSEFIFRYRDEEWVKHLVLVSSVAENLGKGVTENEIDDIFIDTIQKQVNTCLEEKGISPETANEFAKGIKRSKISVEREFLAFTPT